MPYRGGDDEWTVQQCCRDMRKWGIRGDVIVRTDQERALVSLVDEVVALRKAGNDGKTHPRQFEENSPVGESQSNGLSNPASGASRASCER